MKKLSFIVYILLFCFGCQPGPNNEQLKSLRRKITQSLAYTQPKQTAEERETLLKEQEEKITALLQEAKEKYDAEKIQLGQLEHLNLLYEAKNSQTVKNWFTPILKKLSHSKHDSAVVASYYLIAIEESVPFEDFQSLFNQSVHLLFSHQNWGRDLINNLTLRTDFTTEQKIAIIQGITPHIATDASLGTLSNLIQLWKKWVLPMGENLPEEIREACRQKLLTAYQALLVQKDLKKRADIEGEYAFLQTLYAQGKLIGSEAPEIHFIWSNKGDFKTLSALKGKIVILDFWATWCGPCVRSFPNVRKLQERYKNYPVVILGVTSIQGRHIQRKGNQKNTIPLKGQPEEELRLMKEFVQDMNITWPIVFSQESVFNKEYGVSGIPHVVIIDPEGKVRYNELRPYNPPYEEAEKIDALLKEANLPYPQHPMEKINYAS